MEISFQTYLVRSSPGERQSSFLLSNKSITTKPKYSMKAPQEWNLWQFHFASSTVPSVKMLNKLDTQILVE